MDISPNSHHLTAFETINQPLYIDLQVLNAKVFGTIQSLRCRRLLHSDFVISLLSVCAHPVRMHRPQKVTKYG